MPDLLQPAPGRLPPGERVYAVGDVHGCAERLRHMHALVAEDRARHPVARATLVHLGDYVDRGPDSAGVLALLEAGTPPGVEAAVDLMGNHEAMLLDAVRPGAEDAAEHWIGNGGAATLRSWGMHVGTPQGRWAAGIPPGQDAVLRRLTLHHQAGSYLFVHAGVNPRRPLSAQSAHDLLWMREPFLSWTSPLEAVVVHGHTPHRTPEVLAHRIGVDTGAVTGGPLTCVVLEGDGLRFLTA